jgi:DNA-binding PadR family transcriptional regulator
MLEDMGYARAVPEGEGGKKVYEITDEGRKYLAEHSTTVDDIFERIARFVEGFTDTPMTELNQAFQRLARTTYKTATSHMGQKDMIDRLRDIVRRAADEVEAAAKATPPAE